jgi:hypothetical protein
MAIFGVWLNPGLSCPFSGYPDFWPPDALVLNRGVSILAKYFEYKYICIETPIITIHHHSLLKIRHRRFAERLRDK